MDWRVTIVTIDFFRIGLQSADTTVFANFTKDDDGLFSSKTGKMILKDKYKSQ